MIGSVGSSRSSASRSSDSSPTSATKESSPATKETSLEDQEAAAQDAAGTQKAQELQRNYMTDGMDKAAPSDSSKLSGISKPGSTQDVLTKAAKEAGVDPGWAQSEALDSLLNAESSSSINGPLNTDAENPSGAYGIGQLMPETQAQYLPEGADPGNAVSQATAMMSYIRDRYGSPEAAWGFHQSNGWY